MAQIEKDLKQWISNVGSPNGEDMETAADIVDNNGMTYTPPQTASGAGEIYEYENCWFTGATDSALLVDSATVTVSASSFSLNNGTWGGAISNDYGTVSVLNSTFDGNVSTMDGGAICNSGTAAMSVSDSVFVNNKGDYGGAIVNDVESFISIVNCSFANNRGWNFGGAAYNSGTMSIESCGFDGNATDNNEDAAGGAVFNDGLVIVTDSTFSSGSAGWYGGAISNEAGTANISGGRFSGNYADSIGGAIYNEAGSISISGADFVDNAADWIAGAIYNAEDLSVLGGTFAGNFAEDAGGAIYNDNYGDMSVSGVMFSGNSAGIAGGAICNYGGMTITNSIFETETDTIYNGGAVTLAGTVALAADVQTDGGIYSCLSGLALDFINTTS
ncbi:MAG: hypothetical protein MJ025_04425, partial [Victivallaceae bacterium]|nr:hypothetical protein [Victivallaceae bacterium]